MDSYEEIVKQNQHLKEENKKLKLELEETREHLKKYTNGNNHKKYYEKNKEKVMKNGSEYLKKLKEQNPEKIKEYARRAYLKKKEKMEQEKLEKETIENV